MKTPEVSMWFNVIATFSMYPLLAKDGQTVPYMVMQLFYVTLSYTLFQRKIMLILFNVSVLGMLVFHVVVEMFPAGISSNYPDLYPLLWSVFSFAHYLGFFIYFTVTQYRLPLPSKVKSQ